MPAWMLALLGMLGACVVGVVLVRLAGVWVVACVRRARARAEAEGWRDDG